MRIKKAGTMFSISRRALFSLVGIAIICTMQESFAWNFETVNGTNIDYGEARSITWYGTFEPILVPGKFGNALATARHYAEAPYRVELNRSTTLEISAWVWISELNIDERGIVSSGKTKRPFALVVTEDGSLRLKVNQGTTDGVGTGIFTSSSIKVAEGGWHFVCVSYNGSKITFSVDGKIDPVQPQPSPAIVFGSTAEPLILGATYREDDLNMLNLMNGKLDNVSIGTSVSNNATINRRFGLLGSWDLNALSGTTVSDQSLQGATGKAVNGPTMAAGIFSSALSFDGANDFVKFPGVATHYWRSTQSLTFWIKPTSLKANAGIIGWSDSTPRPAPLKAPFQLLMNADGTLKFKGNVNNPVGGTPEAEWNSSLKLTAGKWQHVAVTWDPVAICFYIDGMKDPKANPSNNYYPGVCYDQLVIGANFINNSYFNGRIDQVSVYNRPLTHLEALNLRNESRLLHFDFNEINGLTALDQALGDGVSLGMENGTLKNNPARSLPTALSAFGEYDWGISFNGSPQHVITGNIPSSYQGGENLTVVAQIMPKTLVDYAGIVGLGSSSTDKSPWALCFGKQVNGKVSLIFHVNRGNPTPFTGKGMFESNAVISANQYYHVAVTYDGSNVRFYIDGLLDKTIPAPGMVFGKVAMPLTVGVDFPFSDEYFKGIINDVQVYARALSATELVTPDYAPLFFNHVDRYNEYSKNNCYSYATNCLLEYSNVQNSFPGTKGSDLQDNRFVFTTDDETNKTNMTTALLADGLKIGSKFSTPDPGYTRIAAFLDKNGSGRSDFHFFRQNRDLTWSQKLGSEGFVYKSDYYYFSENRGDVIVDAESAVHHPSDFRDPTSPAGYAVFAGYFYAPSSPKQGANPLIK